jgi:putative ABC transport system substrate-binding protein
VLFDPDITPYPLGFRALGAAAQAKGVTLQPVKLRRTDDLNPALAAMDHARPNALLVFATSAVQQTQIVEFAAKNRLPALYGFREAVDAGGLMSFGPKLLDLWRGAATTSTRSLRAQSPAISPWSSPPRLSSSST